MRCPAVALLGFWIFPLALSHVAATPAAAFQDDDEDRPKGPRLAPGKELGLALTFSRGDVRDTRGARLVDLRVPSGTAPTPFLGPGPFRATWEGDLSIPFRSEYSFFATGRGTIKVEVNGKVALEGSGDDLNRFKGPTARLRKGANKVVVTYDSPTAGDAVVRLAWSSEDFGREPIPPMALARDVAGESLAAGHRLREGRELVANLRCLHCHAPDSPIDGPGRMPELAVDAPNLSDAGARLDAGWMARWIEDPKALRPAATMPKMPGVDGAAARDIAAYLATLGKPSGELPAATTEAVATGGRLFANLGCVGCHNLPDAEKDDPKRIPLRLVAAKWQGPALVAFLRQPDRHYASIRMPNFHLSAAEADQLAAYLASASSKDMPTPAVSDPARGKALFASAGCASCHALPGLAAKPSTTFAAITPEGWARGCLGPGDGKAPDFALTPSQVLSVRAFAKAGLGSFASDSAPEVAERQVKALRCIACHKRDGYDAAWSDLQVEVDKLLVGSPAEEKDPDGLPYPAAQDRPSLTWIGEKLRPEWSAGFIAGKVPYKPRPYLRARMPAFALHADALAVGLALEHGEAATRPPEGASDPELIPVAKQLVKNTGLNCVSCHNIGKTPAVGVFEAPGVNFMHVKERLLPAYYDRWVRSPIRVEPDTKMPTYFNGENSVLPTILDGKADKQINALWNYILQGKAIEPPGN